MLLDKDGLGQEKILYLESLRGLAALSVAIGHSNMSSVLNNAFTDAAWLMVDFFFVLSGFVIALNYQTKIKTFSHAVNFQLRRFLRLYPLHIITLLIFVGWEALQYLNEMYGGIDRAQLAFSKNNLSTFLQHIFLVQNLTGNHDTWNFPSWSISAEFYTYAVFALVLLASCGKRAVVVLLAFTVSIAAFYYLVHRDMSAGNGFARCLLSFFIGVLTFNLATVVRTRLPNVISYLTFVLCIYLVVYASKSTDIGLNIALPVFFSALILSLSCAEGPNFLKRLLEAPKLVYLGTISYGIYMIHASVWIGLALAQKYVLGINTVVATDGVQRIAYSAQWQVEVATLAGLCITVLFAHYSYRFIERPANNLRHKLNKLA